MPRIWAQNTHTCVGWTISKNKTYRSSRQQSGALNEWLNFMKYTTNDNEFYYFSTNCSYVRMLCHHLFDLILISNSKFRSKNSGSMIPTGFIFPRIWTMVLWSVIINSGFVRENKSFLLFKCHMLESIFNYLPLATIRRSSNVQNKILLGHFYSDPL